MTKKNITSPIPLLPLRDVVVYPNMVVPLFVGRPKSIVALENSMNVNNKKILLVTQKSSEIDNPEPDNLYKIGSIATILQLLKLPDGTMKVLVEGQSRAEIVDISEDNSHLVASYNEINEDSHVLNQNQADALCRTLESTFNQYVKLNKKVPPEVLSSVAGISDVSKLADSIAAHMTLKMDEKQKQLQAQKQPHQHLPGFRRLKRKTVH